MSAWVRTLVMTVAMFGALASQGRAQGEGSYNPHGELDIDCSACHTSEAWTPAKAVFDFDHDDQTDFPLDGIHKEALCVSCHLDLRFDEPKVSKLQCSSCHVDVHLGNLSNNCVGCHNAFSFTDVPGVLVHTQTNFPLTGAHLQTSCETCHSTDVGGAFTTLNVVCVSCHDQEYFAAQMPDHAAANFPRECENCHDTLAWTHAALDHVGLSGYELIGAHRRIECTSCHTPPQLDLVYFPMDETDCIACHQSEFQSVHPGGSVPTTCLDCHTNDTWEGAGFNHMEIANGYELVEAHANLDCTACHIEPGFELIVTPVDQNDCFACHFVEYLDNHRETGTPTTCLECHSQTDWADVEENGGGQ